MTTETIYISVTVALLLLLVLIELLAPAREYTQKQKENSYITNLCVFLSNTLVTFALQISAVFAVVSLWSLNSHYFTAMPVWAQAVVGVLILDFAIWAWHRLNHVIPFLWIFHKCHHAETYLNASSALRFHIGELLLSVLWKSLILIAVGIPLWVFLLSEFLLTLFALFHHANIQLSTGVRYIVELFVITPYLHRVHHSDIQDEHDNNYGVIFSIWDRMFGTLHEVVPDRIGLQGIGDKDILSFLLFPFKKK